MDPSASTPMAADIIPHAFCTPCAVDSSFDPNAFAWPTAESSPDTIFLVSVTISRMAVATVLMVGVCC